MSMGQGPTGEYIRTITNDKETYTILNPLVSLYLVYLCTRLSHLKDICCQVPGYTTYKKKSSPFVPRLSMAYLYYKPSCNRANYGISVVNLVYISRI